MNWLEKENEEKNKKAFLLAMLASVFAPLTFILILFIIGLFIDLYKYLFNW